MSTRPEIINFKNREDCAVCGKRQLEVAINLPNLPLTGLYSKELIKDSVAGIDQHFLFCTVCGHAQLARQVDPNMIYGENYSFRTSNSVSAQYGTSFFLSILDEIAPRNYFKCAIDVGCNDLYLLEQLNGRAKTRIGIDPILDSKETQKYEKDIIIIGDTIEDAEINSMIDVSPDLILCRHTLEHIFNPRLVLQKLFNISTKETLFLFEVPGFDALVRRLRFDQIFHQHLQYFSLTSFGYILKKMGYKIILHRENYHNWGSLIVAFVKETNGQGKRDDSLVPIYDMTKIRERYEVFCRQMSIINDLLKTLEGTLIYGYGAAQMLPVLSYNLRNDLSLLKAVLDDDPAKDGIYYWNLPIRIRHTDSVNDIKESSVFITAVDNVKPILSKLLIQRPRHIIYPLNII